jgi:hypothetical protein
VLGALGILYLGLTFSYPPQHRALDPAKKYSPILARGDGHYLYMGTLSLALDRDFDLTNERRRFGAPFGGRYYPLGPSLLFLPTFAVAHGSAWVANRFGAAIPMHGYTLWHQRITFLATVGAGFFALLLGFGLARRHVSEAAALYATAAVGLGSALLFYSVYWTSYAHAWTALTVTMFVSVWDRTRGRFDARRWAALGALAGLAALTRMQEVLWALLAAGELAVEAARRLRRGDARGVAALLPAAGAATACALLVAAPELLSNKLMFGRWLAVYTGESYMRWEAPFFWETLFATKNGLFVWTPIAYAGAAGLLLAPRASRPLALALAAGFLLQTWVNGSAWAWWSAWSYSNRRFLGVTVAVLVGCAFVVERLHALHARRPRLLPHVALAAALLPFAVFNVELSTAVSRGHQSVLRDTSTDALYLGSLTRIARRVRMALGSPTSWPHNWIWAARHRVSPGRYDDIVGSELLFFPHTDYGRPGARRSGAIAIHAASLARFGAGPWGDPGADGQSGAWAKPGARLLVPLLVADRVHLLLTGGRPEPAEVTVQVGDHRRSVRFDLARQVVRLDLPAGALLPGTNEIRFECDSALRPGCVRLERLEAVYEVPREPRPASPAR